jgi:hypothetical protein
LLLTTATRDERWGEWRGGIRRKWLGYMGGRGDLRAREREGGGRERERERERESWWMGEEGERKIIEDEERGPEWEALSEV